MCKCTINFCKSTVFWKLYFANRLTLYRSLFNPFNFTSGSEPFSNCAKSYGNLLFRIQLPKCLHQLYVVNADQFSEFGV